MKNYRLLLVLGLFIFSLKVFGCGPSPEIKGPSSSCHGSVETYFVNSPDCFFSLSSVSITNGSLISRDDIAGEVTVLWNNNGSSNITGTLSLGYQYFPGSCPEPGQPLPQIQNSTLSKQVTIGSNNLVVQRPSSVTSTFNFVNDLGFQYWSGPKSYYQFNSTVPSNTEGLDWTVTGGQISQNNGTSIKVIPNNGVCSITANVRARKTSCTGKVSYSSWKSSTITIPTPTTPGSFSGNGVQPGGCTLVSVTPQSEATYYEWRVDELNTCGSISQWLTQGPISVSQPPRGSTAQVCLSSSCPNSLGFRVYVRAFNSCGQSVNEGSVFISNMGFVNSSVKSTIYPNPAKSGQSISLSNDLEFNSIIIKSISGEQIKTTKKGDFGNLKPGIYLVDIYTSSGVVQEKLIIE